jgi:hypothetical protein
MINVVALATFIEGKLNANTEGLVFRTYTFDKVLDKRYELVDQEKTNFIPTIISTPIGSYLPMNDIQGSRMSLSLEMMLPLELKQDWLDMLNTFIYSINGKVFYLQGTTFNTTVPVSGAFTTVKITAQVPTYGLVSPANFEVVKDIASYLPINRTSEYVGITVPMSIKTVTGFVVGDDIKVSIVAYNGEATGNLATGYYKIKTSDFAIKNSKIPVTDHFINQATAKTFISQNDLKFILTAYYERVAILNSILTDIATGANQNKNYWLKLELPSGTVYHRVILFDNSAVFPIDDYALIPMVFARAYF